MNNIKNLPLVSVIIPTFNRKNLLRYAIQSILNQTYINYEIIVINDYGEDAWDIIESFQVDKIKYLSHIKNLGLPATRNTGITASKGEIICYLDDDDLFLSHHLEQLIKIFTKLEHVNVAYTDAKYINEIITKHIRITVSEKDTYFNKVYSFQKLMIGNYIPINSISHRKSILKEIGLFDEDIKFHEDWDFLLRLAKNHHFYYTNQVSAEVRNRINLQDSMLSNGRNTFYNTYKLIYSKYPSSDLKINKERQKILYTWSKFQKTSTTLLKFYQLANSLTHLIYFAFLTIREKMDQKKQKKLFKISENFTMNDK